MSHNQIQDKDQFIVRLSSQESIMKINDFPNLPNTFPVSQQNQIDDDDDELSQLESDLLDSDEMN